MFRNNSLSGEITDAIAFSGRRVVQERAYGAPRIELEDGTYVVRFARNVEEVEAALKLRFEVFNLELGEGLDSSFQTGRDRDEFDASCHHLIVLPERNYMERSGSNTEPRAVATGSKHSSPSKTAIKTN